MYLTESANNICENRLSRSGAGNIRVKITDILNIRLRSLLISYTACLDISTLASLGILRTRATGKFNAVIGTKTYDLP